jgi:LacI family transcriptional regulator
LLFYPFFVIFPKNHDDCAELAEKRMKKRDSYTLKKISEKTGFSETTVSRVLSNQAAKYRISTKTEKAILAVADELHFAPNQLARSLRLQKTNTIGLIVPNLDNPFFANIAHHVVKEARKTGYAIILADSEDSEAVEIDILHNLRGWKVDGFLIAPVGQHSAHLQRLFTSEVPLVLIDRYFQDTPIPYVGAENYGAAYRSVSHLILNGHTRIACIKGLSSTLPSEERLRGYRQAHADHDLPIDETLIVGDSFGYQNGYIEMRLLLRYEPKPTAVFTMSNLITLGALQAIAEEDLGVPEDISLVSFDDQPYSGLLSTPLTAVAHQNEQIGSIAVKMLLHLIGSKAARTIKGVLVPSQLIYRSSVKNLRRPGQPALEAC